MGLGLLRLWGFREVLGGSGSRVSSSLCLRMEARKACPDQRRTQCLVGFGGAESFLQSQGIASIKRDQAGGGFEVWRFLFVMTAPIFVLRLGGPSLGFHSSYLWLVGNGGMGYNYNDYYYHSSIPYYPKVGHSFLPFLRSFAWQLSHGAVKPLQQAALHPTALQTTALNSDPRA